MEPPALPESSLAPLQRRLHLSFESGAREGGKILFDEAASNLRGRRIREVQSTLAFSLPLVGLLTLGLFSPRVVGASVVIFEGGLALLIATMIVGTFLVAKDVSPVRVYERGVSLGQHGRPFIPFDCIQGLELLPETSSHFERLFVTFVDGDRMAISLGKRSPLANNPRAEEMRAALFAARPLGIHPRLPWDDEARRFVEAQRPPMGPLWSTTERAATKAGETRVTVSFLASHYLEIARGLGHGADAFKVAAFEQFGRQTAAPADPET